MVSLWILPPAALLLQAVMTVVESQRSPNYKHYSICAVKGSTVTMSFTYIRALFAVPSKVYWSKETAASSEPPDLALEPEYRGRVRYSRVNDQGWALILSNVTEEDQRKYYAVIILNSGRRVEGGQGVNLTVTALQGEMIYDTVVEGNEVTLTCKTTCGPTETPTFTWYRNGLELFSINPLHLQSVSNRDAGSYSCGLKGQSYRSPEVTLNVFYPPKSVSVFISPSDEVMEDSVVTLTCSSDANPPVHRYTWYKGKIAISKGQSYSIKKVSSEDSGEYRCLVENQYGEEYSDGATVNVLYRPKGVLVIISPSGEIVEGSSVTLTCISDANPPEQSYIWYKDRYVIGIGKTYSINKASSENSGVYMCKSSNIYGEEYSSEVTLNVLHPPKSVSVSISPSGEIVEGSSVTLTCSSDVNPVEYAWIKGISIIGTTKTYTFSKIRSEESGKYKCKSKNRYGEKYSEESTINVLYPPKRVSASVSPSGDIMEGSSVTLTCSSNANPPVQRYAWYKGAIMMAKRETYVIRRISSEDSGEYKCKSSNQYGAKSSKVTLNVLYPPKNVSASISDLVEGNSVTLTCSSDANPPVQSYTWYKVNKSSPVGSGQSYSFMMSSNSSGEFYCVAQNKYGSQRSPAVFVRLYASYSSDLSFSSVVLSVAVCVGGLCVIGAFIIGIYCVRRKRQKRNQEVPPAEDSTYMSLDPMTRSSNDVYSTLATVRKHR
ncbi:B-cell receptor CD22-like isoform X2 [Hemibagrus wyckioides]|uniref:B-cell receptor CD22-like isoform X2 n=1 Tax=Hemibagrus wyckioides TaxID=337641 RepID=UPI00266BE767|nr:B-cell receptor CD22-like isoform X2 [Hemibagrus wyckioides]